MLDMLQTVLSSDQVLRQLKNAGEITDHQIQQLQQLIPQFQAQQQQQQQQMQQQQQQQMQQQQQQQQQQQLPQVQQHHQQPPAFIRVSPQVLFT
jgi:aminoglycoside phosphotransferase family enzyme